MSDINPTKNPGDGEIDLLDLMQRIGKSLNTSLKALGRGIIISVVFILRKWLPLGISIIAGIGLSFLMKIASPSFYTTDMILRTNCESASAMIPYINKLNTYCLEGNSGALSEALSVEPESVKDIDEISAYWIIDQNKDLIPDYVDYKNNHNVYDTNNVRMIDRLNVRAKIKSPQELALFRDGIIKFINKDSLFQQKNRLRLRQNQELLTRLNEDIFLLDSLQKVKYFEETRNRGSENGGQMIFLQEQKTQLLYSDILDLHSRKQILDAERDLYKDLVTVLSDFSLPARRDNGTAYYAVKVIPAFYGLTLIILIMLANRKKVNEIFEKY